ncbi:sugar transferase [Ornithinibacillus halophilus]
MDIFISVVLLFVLSPVLFFICLLIYSVDGRPAFFKQKRVGKDGRPFTILKLRTMRQHTAKKNVTYQTDIDEPWDMGVPDIFIFKSTRQKEVTNLGYFLRKYSLDEIPQLVNVLKGDMSLIGPRPEIPAIADYYNSHQRKRLIVRPGITGYAQVNGRSNMTHGEKIDYDLYYVENCSMLLDAKILFLTIIQVFRAKGAV